MGLYDLLNTIGEVSPNLMLMFDTLRNKEVLSQAMEYRLRCKENNMYMDVDVEKADVQELTKHIDQLLSEKENNDISISLANGYYLRRTPYRIELRHKNSTTWLAYVIYRDRDISPKEIARILKKKYLILIGNSVE